MYRRRYFAPFTVTTPDVSDNAITGDKIRDGTITQADLGLSSVGSGELKDGAVTTAKIKDGNITPEKLSFTPPSMTRPISPPVTTAEISAGSVTPEKLSFLPATRPMVPPLLAPEITDLNIITSKIADGNVTADKLGVSAVETPKIKDGNVTAIKLSTDSVEETKIKTDAVVKSKIKDGNVSPVKLEAVDAPADQEIPVYDEATGKFEWKGVPAGVGVFVPRRVVIEDFDAGSFICDGLPHVDGLDLSGIVPVGATAVVLQVKGTSTDVDRLLHIGTNNGDAAYNNMWYRSQVADVMRESMCVLPIDPDRLMDYQIENTYAYIELMVIGWYI